MPESACRTEDCWPGAVDFWAAVEGLWVVVAAVTRFLDGPASPSLRDIVVDVVTLELIIFVCRLLGCYRGIIGFRCSCCQQLRVCHRPLVSSLSFCCRRKIK